MGVFAGEPVVSIGESLHGMDVAVDDFSDMTVQARMANNAVSRNERTGVSVSHESKVLSG
jgi:hypothetical protein